MLFCLVFVVHFFLQRHLTTTRAHLFHSSADGFRDEQFIAWIYVDRIQWISLSCIDIDWWLMCWKVLWWLYFRGVTSFRSTRSSSFNCC